MIENNLLQTYQFSAIEVLKFDLQEQEKELDEVIKLIEDMVYENVIL